jgi:CHAT domain-containing protein
MGSAKSRSIVWYWPNLTRYSLTVLLSVVMLAESVGATPRNTQLQMAQQSGTPQDANRAAAEKLRFLQTAQIAQQPQPTATESNNPRDWRNIPGLLDEIKELDSKGTPGAKAALQQVWSRDKQLGEEARKFFLQGTPEAYRQAILIYQEKLKIWQSAEIKQAVPKNARYQEGVAYRFIVFNYNFLAEFQLSLESAQKALVIFRELKAQFFEADTFLLIGNIYNNLGKYQEALVSYNQALQLQRAIPDLEGQAITLDAIISLYSLLGEYQKALSYYNQALDIHRQRKDSNREVQVLTTGAEIYVQLQQPQQAISLLNQALQILQKAEVNLSGQDLKNNLRNQASVYLTFSNVYLADNNYPKAISSFEQARAIYKKTQDTKLEAGVIRNISIIYGGLLGEPEKALSLLEEARSLQQSIADKEGESETINNIADVFLRQGEIQKALDYYQQALDIQRQLKLLPIQASTLQNIAKVYSSLGDYQRSIDTYKQALKIFQQIGNKDEEAATLRYIGGVYRQDKQYQSSLDYFNQALQLSRRQKNIPGESLSLHNIARTYVLWKDNKDSYKLGLQAANEFLTLGQKYNNSQWHVQALGMLAQIYQVSGEYPKALSYINQALSLFRQQGFIYGEAFIIGRQGDIYNSLKQPDKAIQAYNQQLALVRKSGEKTEEVKTLYNLAVTESDRGNLKQAEIYIQETIKIVEGIRSQVKGEDLRTSYFATVQDYYKFYIDLLMQLHKKEPSKGYAALALNISEKSRARGLIELLTEARADIRKGVDPKLLAGERRLRWKLDALAKRLQEPKLKETERIALKQEIETLINQQKELQTKIRTSSPKYAALQYPEPLKLSEIQQQLDQDTLLLQYSLGKERSYLWAVTPNSVDSYELPGRETIEDESNFFRKVLVARTATNELTESATELSQQILAPVANKLGKKRLVIVADGALQNIPFAALADLNSQLPSPSKKVEGEVNYQPLLVNHEIVNLPSASTIAILRQEAKGRKVPPKALAVLADPVFSAKDSRVTGKPDNELGPELDLQNSDLARSAKNLNRDGWDRLDGTRQEAEAILKLVSPKDSLQALNFDANYSWITSPQLSQYRVIHFATHGFADGINPELSGIVLSLVNQQGRPTRGFLRLNDIFNLDFPADLVVLSACETGVGKNVEGEGLVGLTRGLMYAGSQRLVVSLWNVSDEGTSLLMSEFYHQMLKQGKSPTAALRAAQLKLWEQKDWRSPLYWAAFTLQGEWR